MDAHISRAEYEEFKQRLEEENRRQNKRIEVMEDNMKRLEMVNVSVEKLATNMEHMLKEQIRQGERLGTLESRDGDMWRKIIAYSLTAIIGIVIGFIFNLIGM